MTGPSLRAYAQFPTDRPRPSSDLYAISDRVLARDVVAVIVTEGPIHADLLYYRMAKLYGVERAGGEVRRVVDRALREATRAADVVRRGRFYWPAALERAQPRLAGPRSVEQIAPEELHETVMLVLRAQGPLAPDDLIRAAARALGFQRTGAGLAAGIGAAIDTLLASGCAARREGGIVVQE